MVIYHGTIRKKKSPNQPLQVPHKPPPRRQTAEKLFQDLPKSPAADPMKVLFQILDDASPQKNTHEPVGS